LKNRYKNTKWFEVICQIKKDKEARTFGNLPVKANKIKTMRKFNEREKEIIKKLCEITFSETEFFVHFLHTKYFLRSKLKH
jgi:hypothetical protein